MLVSDETEAGCSSLLESWPRVLAQGSPLPVPSMPEALRRVVPMAWVSGQKMPLLCLATLRELQASHTYVYLFITQEC